jgi:hypothetical protein
MHLLRGAYDGIYWTGLNAQSAPNTFLWINKCHRPWALNATCRIDLGVELKGILRVDRGQDFAEPFDSLYAARRAAVR